MIYESLIRPTFFKMWKPEQAHERVMSMLVAADRMRVVLPVVGSLAAYRHASLEQRLLGIHFPNPVGLAGGFDKNGVAVPAFEALGFGFVEVGTVTRHAQPGNAQPRLFRLPADEALINRMGFNNEGADVLAQRLQLVRPRVQIPIGVSIGKSKVTPIEEAVDDYLYSFRKLYFLGDYFAINVSSPNTPNLRKLLDRDELERLLAALMRVREEFAQGGSRKPMLVKVAPDLTPEALDDVIDVCQAHGADGLIATNTTVGREGLVTRIDETGGLSGRPLFVRALEFVRHIRERMPETVIMGSGGVFDPQDAVKMIQAGANLVQVYTGFVYRGPLCAPAINRGLAKQMQKQGRSSLSQLRN